MDCRECGKYDKKEAMYHVKAIVFDYYYKPHNYEGYLCEDHLKALKDNQAHITSLHLMNKE